MRTLCTAVSVVVLLAGAPPAPAQVGADVLERAIALNEVEGPAATLRFLEEERARGDLSPPAQALLGALLMAAGRGEDAYLTLEPITQSQQAPAAVLFNTWRAASMTGRGEERIDLLERAVAADPVSPAGRQLGLMRGASGQLEEALVLLGPWARAQPEDVEARLAAAVAALQLQRLPEADEFLQGLPEDIPQVELLRGKALLLRGDPNGAIETLQTLGYNNTLSPGIERDRRHTMANAYIGIGQAADAVALLEGRERNDPGLTLVLARAQAQSGDVSSALETIRPLAERVLLQPEAFPNDLAAGALLQYGRQLIATGSPKEAIEPLELASQIDPYQESIWQSLGQALAVAGRREEARIALERFNELAQNAVPTSVQQSSLERGLDDPTGRQLREAIVLMGQEREEEALALIRSERRLAPDDRRIPVIEAQILGSMGRVDEALATLDAAIAEGPDHADAYYQRGVILMGRQRLQEAESAFRQVLQIAPLHLPTMNDLAVLLMLHGRNDEARTLLEKVLELNPDDELAAGNLSSLDGQ